jgi:transposase
MATQTICCRYCESDHVVRYGTQSGLPRYRCKCCGRVFKTEYIYRACEPGIKDQIVEMVLNGSGTRDTARVLGIGKGTVTATLKKSPPKLFP